MSEEFLVYTLRPDGTSLWLPWEMVRDLGIKKGARLTEEQFQSAPVQEHLKAMIERQEGKKRK